MKALNPDLVEPIVAVSSFKHLAFVKVQAEIIQAGLQHDVFSPNDIPEDIVAKEDRQGVVSNAWNSLEALEIIERLPVTFHDADRKIFGGKIRSTHKSRKGAWACVYKMKDATLARTWLIRNADEIRKANEPQRELAI
jgi:hypothetical protein